MSMGADVGNPSDLLKNGATIGFGNSSASSNTTNTPMNHDSNNTLPYIQTNCGSGVGLPCLIDPAFLWKMFLELREPFAREFIKKVKEKLPDSTIEPITVKRDIYKKILLVIQAHLQHENGQAMLKKHIETLIENELKFFNGDDQMKKRIIENILKKPSKISEKLIEIIASNSVKPEQPKETTDSCTGTGSKPVDNKQSFLSRFKNKKSSSSSAGTSSAASSSAASSSDASSSAASSSDASSSLAQSNVDDDEIREPESVKNGGNKLIGGDGEDDKKDKKDIFNIDIEKVVHEFSNWLGCSIENFFETSNKEQLIQGCIDGQQSITRDTSKKEEDSDKKIVLCIDDVDHGGPASCENYNDIYNAAKEIHREDKHKNKPSFEKQKHAKIMEDLDKFQTEMDKKCDKNTSGENKSEVASNSESNVEDEIVKVSIDAINNQSRPTSVDDVSVEVVEDEKKRKNLEIFETSLNSKSPTNDEKKSQILVTRDDNDYIKKEKNKNYNGPKDDLFVGGKSKTKKRRTKNNKRKTMKHKKRRTKKNRKHKK